jgi:hypothetical protein
VLLSSDTHRKRITSITAVLLPFVIYLLTLLKAQVFRMWTDECLRTVSNGGMLRKRELTAQHIGPAVLFLLAVLTAVVTYRSVSCGNNAVLSVQN